MPAERCRLPSWKRPGSARAGAGGMAGLPRSRPCTMPPCRRSPDDLRPAVRTSSYWVPDEKAPEKITLLTGGPPTGSLPAATALTWACGAVVARVAYNDKVTGSSPVTPTTVDRSSAPGPSEGPHVASEDARRRGGYRRRSRGPVARWTVPAVGRPADRHSRTAPEGETSRGLPLALVGLPVAGRREPGRRPHRRRRLAGGRAGAVRRGLAPDRPDGRPAGRPRRTPGGARRSDPFRDRRPARNGRHRRGGRGVGRGPADPHMAGRARVGPRGPVTREPAGRRRPAQRRHRLRGRRRPCLRPDRRVEPPPRRYEEPLPRRTPGRRRHVGAGSGLGAVHRAHPTPVLPPHEPCARGQRPARDR